jgi:hypothetical protein
VPQENAQQRLLLAACRYWCEENQSSVGIGQSASAVLSREQGEDLVRLACQHGVLPLLHHYLENHPGQVSEVVRERVREEHAINAGRNLSMLSQLLHLLDKLSSVALVVPWKGPVLAMDAYGRLDARQFTDLDLLTHPDHFSAVCAAMLDFGFVTKPSDEGPLQVKSNTADFVHAKTGLMVEIHDRFTQDILSVPMTIPDAFQRLSSLELAGKSIRTLCPEDTFLMLAVHGYKHYWERLGWIADFAAQVSAHSEMNWDGIREQARKSGLLRVVRVALLLAKRMGCELPAGAEAIANADAVASQLADQVEGWMFANRKAFPIVWRRNLYLIRIRENWRDRWPMIKLTAQWLATPNDRDREWIRLPNRLSWIYYGIRPLRLLTHGLTGGSRSRK